jgi:hypothetical protein
LEQALLLRFSTNWAEKNESQMSCTDFATLKVEIALQKDHQRIKPRYFVAKRPSEFQIHRALIGRLESEA